MKKNLLIRFTVIAGIILLVVCLVYFAFLKFAPDLIQLLKNGSEAEIEQYLRSNDSVTGLFCMALLQMIQVLSILLPAVPIQIAAGIVYGTWRSFLVCHLSSVAAHILVFTVARHLGSKINALIPVESKGSKLDFLLKSEHPAYMTVVACLIPILPNGFIPYVAAKTNIKPQHFALSVYCGTFLPALVLCAAGDKFLTGGYVMSAALLIALCILVFVMTKFKTQILSLIDKCFVKQRKHFGRFRDGRCKTDNTGPKV
jgi:uncharacterized membrane protein YdjX (TVP38/TMEM64 family)